jgi:hypothetical protein
MPKRKLREYCQETFPYGDYGNVVRHSTGTAGRRRQKLFAVTFSAYASTLLDLLHFQVSESFLLRAPRGDARLGFFSSVFG